MRVLLSAQLCVSPAPRPRGGYRPVSGGVCGGLRVSTGPLPSPGSLPEARRLSLFPPQTHLPVRGEDPAEVQHLVRLLVSLLSASGRSSLMFSTLNLTLPLSILSSVCRAGQWQCTGERCAARCSLIGALQVTTFDKKRYSLQGGNCPFIAVEVR